MEEGKLPKPMPAVAWLFGAASKSEDTDFASFMSGCQMMLGFAHKHPELIDKFYAQFFGYFEHVVVPLGRRMGHPQADAPIEVIERQWDERIEELAEIINSD